MIKIYGMKTCPDCIAVDEQVKGDDRYQVIDIGEHVRNLKEFLRLRDTSAVFDEAKQMGYAGIPCFVLEDGTVTLSPEEAGLGTPAADAPSCRLDGTGC
ncbi:MAG: glutaredoxin-related protein [Prevotella sp.]|nr:glutaredoxin-related protein [Prevotella sp.]